MRALALAAALAAVGAMLTAAPADATTVRTMGRISIPAIGLDAIFFNGQSAAATANGPSHYPWTAMPGQGRTVAIAGHRVTHTHPFLHLDRLRAGDRIVVHYGRAPSFPKVACYRMQRTTVVSPSAAGVTDDVGVERLVLTTCTPPHSATYRLVVFARRTASC